MKNLYSYLACISISLVLIIFRISYTDKSSQLPIKVTTWDALGYYMYLPSSIIYHDEKDLNWFPKIDSTYSLSGGNLYQANRQQNGNFVFKYLGGVSILELPGFLIAHWYALHSRYPADGFSAPYQYAVAWSCILFCILSIFLLRHILLLYFSDQVVAITLILLLIASNFIQYISIDSGQSHGYIFPLYVLIIYFSIKWHENKKFIWSILIGLTIGIATISRPTEAIMLFILLLWDVKTKQDFKNKIAFLFKNPIHLILIGAAILIAISPQLFYWKRVTGSWVYDVGSKWNFLNPHFRVLFGWEKGWFIYTPVTLLFVLGLFFMNGKSFQRSIITFCLINIYIIIAWHVWRYGGSYSCRALVQSYPVFSFALAGIITYLNNHRFKWIFWLLSLYLIFVNFIQLVQYNKTILHFDDMNFAYYKAIYLKIYPTPLDMSLLDTEDILRNENQFSQKEMYSNSQPLEIQNASVLFKGDSSLKQNSYWLKIDARISKSRSLWGTYFINKYPDHDTMAIKKIRLFNAISNEGKLNDYSYFINLPPETKLSDLIISTEGNEGFHGVLEQIKITQFLKYKN